MKIVVGLGNPGKRYGRGRHNLGFMVVDHLAGEHYVSVSEKKYRSLVGSWELDNERILLVKPQSYMNRSGEAVTSLFRYLPVSGEDLVVIHDDLDLPFGRIRIRTKGSAGGHRGILSILQALGNESFFRIRIGIGRPPGGVDPTGFVLSPFTEEEQPLVEQVVSRAAQSVQSLLKDGVRQAMEKFNQSN